MNDEIFKPGYDGERPSTRLTGPEKQTFLKQKAELVDRLHNAMLTLRSVGGGHDLRIKSNAPEYIQEFGDRVGEEDKGATRAIFRPSGAMVDDMLNALQLLDGVRPDFRKVLELRAIDTFQRDEGEQGDWPWDKIGTLMGMSGVWAEAAYDACIVQAARRAGLLPMISLDHAIVSVAVFNGHVWLSSISTAGDPRQESWILRSRSPVPLEQGFALWTAGKPLTKRVLEAAKPELRARLSHGSWYKVGPNAMADILIQAARQTDTPWYLEELNVARAKAA